MIHATDLDRSWNPSATSHDIVIDGCSSGDARDVTDVLFNSAANSYKVLNLQSQIHLDCEDSGACERLQRLYAAQSEVRTLLDQAQATGRRVQVSTRIEVKFLDGGAAR